jgi:hypothetical protein
MRVQSIASDGILVPVVRPNEERRDDDQSIILRIGEGNESTNLKTAVSLEVAGVASDLLQAVGDWIRQPRRAVTPREP